MRRRASWLVLLAASLMLLGTAAPAGAYSVLGRSTGTRLVRDGVRLEIARTGRVASFSFGWRAPCRIPAGDATGEETTFRRFVQTRAGFRGTRTTRNTRGGWSFTRTTTVTGRRLSRYVWRGTISARARTTRNGVLVEDCTMRPKRWRASVPAVRLSMTGTPGDYVLGGKSRRFATPRSASIAEVRSRRALVLVVGRWSLVFTLPRGRSFKPGLYEVLAPGGRPETVPSIGVAGEGRGCTASGRFRVWSSSFDRRGRLKAIVMSFVQRCESSTRGELRGTLRLVLR